MPLCVQRVQTVQLRVDLLVFQRLCVPIGLEPYDQRLCLPLRTARHASLVSYTGSWYTACDTEKLQRLPDGNWSHFQSASAFTSLPRTPSIVRSLKWPRSASREKRLALRLPQACTQHAHCVCIACAWHVHGMYLMLRLPQAERGALEWVQPRAAMRVALVLYGKVTAA